MRLAVTSFIFLVLFVSSTPAKANPNNIGACQEPSPWFGPIYQLFTNVVSIMSWSPTDINNSEIPKIINYIWFGRPMQDEYIENIKKTIASNPNFRFVLWYSSRQLSKDSSTEASLSEDFLDKFKGLKLELRDIDKVSPEDLPSDVGFDLFRSAMKYIDMEISNENKKARNYAAGSDIARLLALIINGGLYLDSDSRVDSKIEKIVANHGFLMKINTNSDGELESTNNNLLAATKGSKLAGAILKRIVDNYDKMLKNTAQVDPIKENANLERLKQLSDRISEMRENIEKKRRQLESDNKNHELAKEYYGMIREKRKVESEVDQLTREMDPWTLHTLGTMNSTADVYGFANSYRFDSTLRTSGPEAYREALRDHLYPQHFDRQNQQHMIDNLKFPKGIVVEGDSRGDWKNGGH